MNVMLTPEVLHAIRTERAELFRELSANPIFQRYRALRRLMALYAADVEDDETQGSAPQSDLNRANGSQKVSRPGSRFSQVENAAYEWFTMTGKRAQSSEIMQALRERGLEFPGNKPTTALASILSHSDMFDNVRGQGYGLRAWSVKRAESLDTATNAVPETQTTTPSTGSPPC